MRLLLLVSVYAGLAGAFTPSLSPSLRSAAPSAHSASICAKSSAWGGSNSVTARLTPTPGTHRALFGAGGASLRGSKGRGLAALCMKDKVKITEDSLGDIVSKVEMANALDPQSHSLPERLTHTIQQLTDLKDAIQAQVLIAEEQLAEKKKSLSLLEDRIKRLSDDLQEAEGQDMIDHTKVHPALIVGGGRVGTLLKGVGHADDVIVRSTSEFKYQLREHPGNAPKDGPIYLAVPYESIAELYEATPQERRIDLVYVGTHGVDEGMHDAGTRAAIFFQVESPEQDETYGKVSDPGAMSVVCGKWAGDLARRLMKVDIGTKIGTEEQLQVAQLSYLVWICAVHTVGKMHGLIHVAEVEKQKGAEFEAMLVELGNAVVQSKGVDLGPDYVKKLRAYTAGLDARVVVKPARHRMFWNMSQKARQDKLDDPCPLHSKALKKLKAIP